MKPLLVSSGEPAGIGPDLCLSLAEFAYPLVVLGDKSVLLERAKQLHRDITLIDYVFEKTQVYQKGMLHVLSLPSTVAVTAGVLNPGNGLYVMKMLELASARCLSGEFSGLVTAPVHKEVINQAGVAFTGHTEFLADYYGVERVVMMLACDAMKVALVTTHLPLRQVPSSITHDLLREVIHQLHQGLQQDFGIKHPRIAVAGLNPHAGEGGYLGTEELDIIQPALKQLSNEAIDVQGPFPADTLFTPTYLNKYDVFLTMYHDQGLPVLKYAGFGKAVNVTLGLPIVRTSVDHGTALELAGTGKADSGSLIAAVEMALLIVKNRTNRTN